MSRHPIATLRRNRRPVVVSLIALLILSISSVPYSLSRHIAGPDREASIHETPTRRSAHPAKPDRPSEHVQHFSCLNCVMVMDFDIRASSPTRHHAVLLATVGAYGDPLLKRFLDHAVIARAPPRGDAI